jgi:hypothetical protein
MTLQAILPWLTDLHFPIHASRSSRICLPETIRSNCILAASAVVVVTVLFKPLRGKTPLAAFQLRSARADSTPLLALQTTNFGVISADDHLCHLKLSVVASFLSMRPTH